jgi:hypothetical protein
MGAMTELRQPTSAIPYDTLKAGMVDNVSSPQQPWGTVEKFLTVSSQKKENSETTSDSFYVQPAVSNTAVTYVLKKIPRPFLLARSFEPHVRRDILQALTLRISELNQTLGQPGVAIAMAQLRAELKSVYELATLREDMANFASVISLLQDYCYMHWSKMNSSQLIGIDEALNLLKKKSEVSPKDITRFSAVLRGEGRSIDYPSTEQLYLGDESSDEDQINEG